MIIEIWNNLFDIGEIIYVSNLIPHVSSAESSHASFWVSLSSGKDIQNTRTPRGAEVMMVNSYDKKSLAVIKRSSENDKPYLKLFPMIDRQLADDEISLFEKNTREEYAEFLMVWCKSRSPHNYKVKYRE